MMNTPIRTDIMVTSPEGEMELLIEVKRTPSASAAITELTQLRTYLQVLQQDSYLMLVNPGKFWLWNSTSTVDEPIYEGETPSLLANYIDLQKVPLSQLDERGLISVVYSWLGSIIFKPATTLLTLPTQKWLVDSGLHEHIYRGYIHQEKTLV